MSDEEIVLKRLKETLDVLKGKNVIGRLDFQIRNMVEDCIRVIEKQQKTIDEMAGYLAIIRDCPNENCGANLDCENRCNNDDDLVKECWKMYFERKIEKE